LEAAAVSEASAVLIPLSGISWTNGKPAIAIRNPKHAFARVLEVFAPQSPVPVGIHPLAHVGERLSLGENSAICSHCVVGRDVTVGKNTVIWPFSYIGDEVVIGDDCHIMPSVTILEGVQIGNRVRIQSGAVIGSDGFGFVLVETGHYKIPQIGTVEIADDVEIGAGVTIDRARTGATRIGRGTKIDNLVHIAHNVQIGEDCLIVAQVGIAGSSKLDDRVILAGQVGIKDHVSIGADSIVMAKSGVYGNLPEKSVVSGIPAREHKQRLKTQARVERIHDLNERVKELERRLATLEKRKSSE
jgi:UDP-3-O-[3-hydroxymyristoyl] glucosamine N-acyltransferase